MFTLSGCPTVNVTPRRLSKGFLLCFLFQQNIFYEYQHSTALSISVLQFSIHRSSLKKPNSSILHAHNLLWHLLLFHMQAKDLTKYIQTWILYIFDFKICFCESDLISFPCSEHAQTSAEQEVATLAVFRIVMVAADWLMRTHPFHFGSSCVFIDESLWVLFSPLHLFFFFFLLPFK